MNLPKTFKFFPNLINAVTLSSNRGLFIFIVVNADNDKSIIRQQVHRQLQPWIYHIEPLGMKMPLIGGVGEKLLTFAIDQSGVF